MVKQGIDCVLSRHKEEILFTRDGKQRLDLFVSSLDGMLIIFLYDADTNTCSAAIDSNTGQDLENTEEEAKDEEPEQLELMATSGIGKGE